MPSSRSQQNVHMWLKRGSPGAQWTPATAYASSSEFESSTTSSVLSSASKASSMTSQSGRSFISLADRGLVYDSPTISYHGSSSEDSSSRGSTSDHISIGSRSARSNGGSGKDSAVSKTSRYPRSDAGLSIHEASSHSLLRALLKPRLDYSSSDSSGGQAAKSGYSSSTSASSGFSSVSNVYRSSLNEADSDTDGSTHRGTRSGVSAGQKQAGATVPRPRAISYGLISTSWYGLTSFENGVVTARVVLPDKHRAHSLSLRLTPHALNPADRRNFTQYDV